MSSPNEAVFSCAFRGYGWTHSRQEQERLKRGIERAAQGDLVRYETTNAGPNGRTVHMDISIKPVRNAEGRIVLLISEGRDITDLKLAMGHMQTRETELKVQSRSLEEANIALKVLLKQLVLPYGEMLGISLNTVSSHRHKVRSKLGLRNKGSNLRPYLMSLQE